MFIEPLTASDAEAGGLGSTLGSFERLDDDTSFPRLLGAVPRYAEAVWGAMAEALFEGNVDHGLKELVRIKLATIAKDPYFSKMRSRQAVNAGLTEERVQAALGDYENDDQFTDAEKWALRYSERMYTQPATVDAAFYEAGKAHFTEAQIMELGGLLATHYGMAVFMRTLQPH